MSSGERFARSPSRNTPIAYPRFDENAMTSSLVRRLTTLAVLALPIAAAACDSPAGVENNAQGLARARTRWQTAGIHNYSFVVTPVCFCDTRRFRVTVQNDAVVSRVYLDTESGGGGPVPANLYGNISTVPDMFATIQQAIDHNANTLAATYEEHGVPQEAYIDWQANVFDEELGWTASAFTPAP